MSILEKETKWKIPSGEEVQKLPAPVTWEEARLKEGREGGRQGGRGRGKES